MQYRNVKIESKRYLQEYHHYFVDIVPKFIIEDGIPKRIKYLNPHYHLKGFVIKTVNGLLENVMIFGWHPNADLQTSILCLKDGEKGERISNIHNFANLIRNRLSTYYYDHSHFRPEKRDCKTEPVDAYSRIDVNFSRGEIYESEPPFRRLYPT